MSKLMFWKTENDGSTAWHGRLELWRLKVGYTIYRHTHPDYPFHTKETPDRWVFHPSFVYDRKTTQMLPQRLMRALKRTLSRGER